MLIRWFLFETRVGEWMLTLLEKTVGLAVVQAEWLAAHSPAERRERRVASRK